MLTMKMMVVELDPVILNLARNYFGFCEDKHLKVHIADGIQFVRGVAADGVSGKHVNNDAQCDAECPSSMEVALHLTQSANLGLFSHSRLCVNDDTRSGFLCLLTMTYSLGFFFLEEIVSYDYPFFDGVGLRGHGAMLLMSCLWFSFPKMLS
uniref:Uncharacterized protein n=1 Tax=Vitis vinifera TaxID=29760 RepID=F6GWD2_VITVI